MKKENMIDGLEPRTFIAMEPKDADELALYCGRRVAVIVLSNIFEFKTKSSLLLFKIDILRKGYLPARIVDTSDKYVLFLKKKVNPLSDIVIFNGERIIF